MSRIKWNNGLILYGFFLVLFSPNFVWAVEAKWMKYNVGILNSKVFIPGTLSTQLEELLLKDRKMKSFDKVEISKLDKKKDQWKITVNKAKKRFEPEIGKCL